VVERLRRLPDLARVADVLRAPTRLGVDTRREALAAEADAQGVELPAASRAQAADVARAEGGRIVVRAAGPGLLVVGEGYDPGFAARVDGIEARVLRVNADRLGIVLPEGTHRIVLTHRARGVAAGVVIAGLTALGLVLGSLRSSRLPTRAAGG
jgi:hypothetical protein